MSRLHKPKAGFWIRLCVPIIYPLDRLLFALRFRNLDRMPAPTEGGVIIAVNHVSHIDTLVTARYVWQSGRLPRFMIKASLFDKRVLGAIFRGASQIPVYRGTSDAAQSLRDAAAALDRGEAIVIYPEGTTTKDPAGWPMQAKTGIARLVLLRPDVPVVPVGQWGVHKRGEDVPRTRLLRRRIATFSTGRPLDLSSFGNAEPDAELLRERTDTVMRAVRDEVEVARGRPAPAEFYVPERLYVDQHPRARDARNG